MEGVVVKELIVHRDERGELFEILRSDDSLFRNFGQAYITKCFKGWVKGWHYHRIQWDHFCVIKGKCRIVLYDRREKSSTRGELQEFVFTGAHPRLLSIPAGVVHGFEAIEGDAWILNIPDRPFNREEPDEHRLSLDSPEVPYEKWKGKKGW